MTVLQHFDLDALSGSALSAALIELCERGLLTCTSGSPGDDDATYALAWLPLDTSADYPQSVLERHTENLQRFGNQREQKRKKAHPLSRVGGRLP